MLVFLCQRGFYILTKRFYFYSLIDAEKPSGKRRAAYSWDEYYDLTEIYAFLDQLLEQHPDKLTNVNYGTSYENRTLRAVKLSNKKVSGLIKNIQLILLKVFDKKHVFLLSYFVNVFFLLKGKPNHFHRINYPRS